MCGAFRQHGWRYARDPDKPTAKQCIERISNFCGDAGDKIIHAGQRLFASRVLLSRTSPIGRKTQIHFTRHFILGTHDHFKWRSILASTRLI